MLGLFIIANGLHSLDSQNIDKPFYASVASGRSISFTLEEAHRQLCDFQNFRFCRNSPVNTAHEACKVRGGVLTDPNVDLCDLRTGRSVPLTKVEKEWLLTIRPTNFFRRGNVIDVQAYTPSRFIVQIGFS